MKISIYVCYHTKCNVIIDEDFKYIYCGAEINGKDNYIKGTLRDDIGDNISKKNRILNELTAIYWVWKNDSDSDYIGFMHYRRHLNFTKYQNYEEDMYGVVNYPLVDDGYINKFGLDSNTVDNLISDYDIILPKKFNLSLINEKTVYEHYKNSKYHHISDYIIGCDLLQQKFPELKKSIDNVNNSSAAYFTNIFIMKREIFLRYAEDLFSYVAELEKNLSMHMYNIQECRAIGYIAERFLSIYIDHIKQTNSPKILELQRTFIRYPDIIQDNIDNHCVPIVFSFNNNYAKYAYTSIISLIKNTNTTRTYYIYIMHCDISEDNQELFIKHLKRDNIIIKFINCSGFLDEYKFSIEQDHISRDTYLRLFIPAIFYKFDKIVYLDSDILVKYDISFLYDIDIENKLIAGVHDYIMTGFCTTNCIKTPPYFGCISAKDYIKMINIDVDEYIQAGVLVFNIKEILKRSIFDTFIQLMRNKYWFNDQDIINIACKGSIKIVDIKWNVAHGNGDLHTFFKDLPKTIMNEYFKARQDPYIIHFAGDKKPWFVPTISYGDEFWTITRQSPYYEEILYTNAKQRYNRNLNLLTKIIKKLCPPNSYRRLFCKKIWIFAVQHVIRKFPRQHQS